MRGRPALRPLGLMSLLLVTGCPGPAPDPSPDTTPRLTSVTVTCAPASVNVGKSAQCTANALDQDGQAFAVERYTWKSSDEALATVDAAGKATGRAAGSLQVSASAVVDGVSQSGQAALTVTPVGETIHAMPITQNETWLASDNPHVVTGPLIVGGDSRPTLTLEAGVVVRFAAGTALLVGGSRPGFLVTRGTASAPVTFTSREATPRPGDWGSVWLNADPSSGNRLSHLVIEYAGGAVKLGAEEAPVGIPRAGLLLLSSSLSTTEISSVLVDHLEVRESQTHGVVSVSVDFGAGSRGLNAHHNGQSGLQIGANNAGSIPTDTVLAANTAEVVSISVDAVSRSQTWPKLGSPYRVTSTAQFQLSTSIVEGASDPVLTFAAGTEIQMPEAGAFMAGSSHPGSIVAVGTEAQPIRFVSTATTPQPGAWSGLHFLNGAKSRLEHVVISHAGAKLFDSLGGGGVNVYGELGAFMTHTTIQNASGCGVTVAGTVSTDFTSAEYGNTFVSGGGAAQCPQ